MISLGSPCASFEKKTMTTQNASNSQQTPVTAQQQKVSSTLVLKSLSILLGLFFVFIGTMKITPYLSKDLHKDLVSIGRRQMDDDVNVRVTMCMDSTVDCIRCCCCWHFHAPPPNFHSKRSSIAIYLATNGSVYNDDDNVYFQTCGYGSVTEQINWPFSCTSSWCTYANININNGGKLFFFYCGYTFMFSVLFFFLLPAYRQLLK